jgi:hypothetical protein
MSEELKARTKKFALDVIEQDILKLLREVAG